MSICQLMCIYDKMPIIMKKDLRTIKSEKAIQQAFIELAEERGYENVRIVDIANKANVNRNTIYLHYGSKEEIVSKMIESTFEEGLSKIDISTYGNGRANKDKIQKLFKMVFDVIAENIDFYRLIAIDKNLHGYYQLLLSKLNKIYKDKIKDTKKNQITIEYCLNGIFGVILKWIIYDVGTIEENTQYLTNLFFSNLRMIEFK